MLKEQYGCIVEAREQITKRSDDFEVGIYVETAIILLQESVRQNFGKTRRTRKTCPDLRLPRQRYNFPTV